jgi:hypothetical protein
MDVAFQLQLSDRERATLCDVIECDDQDLDVRFAKFAKAAADEYLRMLLGQSQKRANDFLEFRIYLMIQHVLDGRLPDEDMVCRFFQLSSNEARARLRGVTAKFQRGLHTQIKGSILEILQGANYNEEADRHQIAVNNQTVIDHLNSTLAKADGSLSPVSKVRGTVSTYEMPPASYNLLLQKYA